MKTINESELDRENDITLLLREGIGDINGTLYDGNGDQHKN